MCLKKYILKNFKLKFHPTLSKWSDEWEVTSLLFFSVPTFTVIPDSLRVVSPLNVDSDDGEDDEDSDDDVPSEGVPIEQYRAWLGEWLTARLG